ncbi:ATP-binding protein [Fructobacillus sp. W13]|uniref:ATP-binding protein n=1 Tax=Fructobacillus apis TaxID=2935017 RepID=A0ABT0ZPI2_9LACO|nr:DUF87 domain-containing protein [Fructobacillus apis]MCO0831884.1 ATP-binding protein [Fructobacillus apis]
MTSSRIFLGKKSFSRSFKMTYDQLMAKQLLITGQTGSGKSTSAKRMIHELQKNDLTNIVFDPTGEYGLDLDNCVEYRLTQNAYIDLSNQSAETLVGLFNLNWDGLLITKLAAAITSLRIQQKKW